MKLYTKKGDSGETVIPSIGKVKKSDVFAEFLGTSDELIVSLGSIRTLYMIYGHLNSKELVDLSEFKIQYTLLCINGFLSTGKKVEWKINTKTLEDDIDAIQKKLDPLIKFIIPGGDNPIQDAFHVSRVICRRLERLYSKLNIENIEISSFLNRLSDYLFAKARSSTMYNENLFN